MIPVARSAETSERLLADQREAPRGGPRKYASLVLAAAVGLGVGVLGERFGQGMPAHAVELPATLTDCGVPPEYCMEPPAKKTLRQMDGVLMTRNGELDWHNFQRIMTPFWTEDFKYVTGAFPDTHGLRDWYEHEYLSWNAHFPRAVFTQMIFLGENTTATTTTYGRVKWTGLFNGIEEPGTPVICRITDFYQFDEQARISYNFMMIDWADVFRQLGRPVLPRAALPEGLVLPPSAMYAVPAPASQFADPVAAAAAREVVRQILHEDFVQQSAEAQGWHSDLTFYGPVGFGLARGVEEYRQHFLAPLRQSLGNASMDLYMIVCEDHFCGAHGWLYGDHNSELLGFPASGQRIGLRFGMHWRVEQSKAIEGWAIFDLPHLFQQLGQDMFEIAAATVPGPRPAQIPGLPLPPLV